MTDPEHINQWETEAKEWARLDGEARRLEEMRKIVFSEVVNRSNATAVSKAEHEAYASAEFRAHVKKMVEARTLANIARARMDARKLEFEKWRTMQATRRTEMGLT